MTTLQSTTSALEGRLSAAEEKITGVDALDERIAAVEAAPGAASGDGSSGGEGGEASADVSARLAELEAQLAGLAGLGASSSTTGAASSAEGGTDDGAGDRLTALEQAVEALSVELQTANDSQQTSLQTLSTLQAAIPTLEGMLGDTSQTVEATAEQTSALGQSVETLGGDVQSLAARLGDTESQLDHIGGEYQRGAAMVVAIGDIDRAVSRAEPYNSALESLKLLARDNEMIGETITMLEPMAGDGVPTLGGLKASFGETASQALLAAEGDQSLQDQVGNNVFGIINMRPAGSETAEGGDERAILSRAQARLSGNDLVGAISELSDLEGGAAEVVGPWVEQAEARLAAEAAIQDLRSHAQNLVAQGS